MTTKVILYNASVSIVTNDPELEKVIRRFVRDYYTRPVDDERNYEYVGYCKDRNEYTFLTEQFRHFYQFVAESPYDLLSVEVIDKKEYKLPKANLKMNASRKLRDYQEDVAAFCIEDQTNLKFLPLTMGRGKSILAMYIATKKEGNLALLIEPTFMGKWRDDIMVEHQAKREDIIMLVGKDKDPDGIKLSDFTWMLKKKTAPKFRYVVISLDMFSTMVKLYEENPKECLEKYGMYPMDVMPAMGVGMLASDETHKSFYSVYSCLLYSNVKYVLGMSATLIPDNPTDKRAMEAAFPLRTRYHTAMRKKYIHFVYATFCIERDAMKRLRFTSKIPGGKGFDVYSHIVFEQSVMRHKGMLSCYFDVVKELVDLYFFNDKRRHDDKLLIFVASVAMATLLTKELQKCLPNTKIARYVQADKYSDMLKANVIVSTNQSAGVGITIPDLITGIQTVVVKSEKSNLQASGRLRELPGREVTYVCLYSEQVKKHVQNRGERIRMFRDFAESVDFIRSSVALSTDKHRKKYKFEAGQ